MFDSHKPTQPIPKPICDRSGQPGNTQDVFVVKGETSRSQEIDVKSFHEELCSSDRSGQPDKHNVAVQDDLKYIMRSRCSTSTMS